MFSNAKPWIAGTILMLLASVCFLPVDSLAASAAGAPPAGPLAEIPIELRDGQILVPARINGSPPLRFILKSGEPQSMLSKTCAEARGLIKRWRGFKARTDAGWDQRWKLSGAVFDLCGAKFSPPSLSAGTLPASDPLADGILGGDLFERFVVEIDFSRLRLRLFDPAFYKAAADSISIPLEIRQGIPMINITIPRPEAAPLQTKFIVATDYSMSMALDLRYARSNNLVRLSAPKQCFERETNGEYRAYFGHLPRALLGPFSVTNAEVMIAADSRDAIGCPFLQRFNVVFDRMHHQLLLETNAAFSPGMNPGYRPGKPFLLRLDDEFQIDFSGARISAQGPPYSRFRVVAVGPASPAEQAGMRRGDIVQSVDGQPPGKLSLKQWMSAVGQTGRRSRLEILRDREIVIILLPSHWQSDTND